jgi:hypothetical protein
MKKRISVFAILLTITSCFAQASADSLASHPKTKHKLSIQGTLFYTSISRGGIERDERNIPLLPLSRYTLYIVQFTTVDSLPKVIKSFTTDKKGNFSITLPEGKYGFLTPEELKGELTKGQCLPKNTQTTSNNIINSSEWECNIPCPIQLENISIKNLVLINHLISFCVNCQ